MFLNRGTYGDRQILSEKSVDFLHRPHVISDQSPVSEMVHPRMFAHFPTFGLGWRIQDYCGIKSIGHSGGVDGMRGRMELFPEKDCAAVVLTNSEDRRAYYSILYTAFDMLLGFEPVNWIEAWEKDKESAKKPADPEKIANTSPSLPMNDYAGVFRDIAYGDIIVSIEQGKPVLRFSHTPAFTADLEHWHYDTFRLHWRDHYIPKGLITFTFGSNGKIDAIHLDQPRLLDVDFNELEDQIHKVSG
jgi:hypothetical protein